MKLTRVGVDLAKHVFQVHGVDRAERPAWCKRLKRARWMPRISSVMSRSRLRKYIRTLLIHGARSALRVAPSRTDRLSRWALALAERSHPNVAVTALANKMARVAWAMLRHGTNYQPEHVAA